MVALTAMESNVVAERRSWVLPLVVVGVAGALLLAVAASLALGVRSIPLGEVLAAIRNPVDGNNDHLVVRDLRVPRTVVGLMAGAALGAAGTVIQGVTRNPIADPGLLGINSGASLAVVVAISTLGLTQPTEFIWFAFGGAAVASTIVFAVGRAQPVRLALVGAAVTAFLTPLITLVLLADTEAFDQFRFWSIGALTGRDLAGATQLWPVLLIGLVLALVLAPRLNLLALGEELSTGLGQNVAATRAMAAVAIVVLSGTATALAGPIALVGLVVPHLARKLVGTDYRAVTGLALLLGPTMLLLADVLGRLVVRPGELEAGVVAAFIGAPVLISVVRSGGAYDG